MAEMTTKQALQEVVREYKHLMKTGMPQHQAFAVLEDMLYDLIEFERTRSYDIGVEAGRYSILYQLWLYRDAEIVLKKYNQES